MRLDSDIKILEAAYLAVYNTESTETLRRQMETHGFTPDRMQTGKTLLAKAKHWQRDQLSQYDDQWGLTRRIDAQLENAQTQFKEHASIVQIALRNEPVVLQSLKIDRFASKGWACIQQAEHFYIRLQEQNLSLENYGISKRELQQAEASVRALSAMKKERTRKKGLAANSTQAKRAAFRELRSWVMEFRSIARMAFKDNPQMLEAFGAPVLEKV